MRHKMAPPLRHEQRQLIIALREKGMRIVDICQRIGVSKKTVYLWLRRHDTEGTVERQRRDQFFRKTTVEEDRAIVAAHIENPAMSTSTTAAQFQVSNLTIRRRLHQAGVRHRKPAKKKKAEGEDQQDPQKTYKLESDFDDLSSVSAEYDSENTDEDKDLKYDSENTDEDKDLKCDSENTDEDKDLKYDSENTDEDKNVIHLQDLDLAKQLEDGALNDRLVFEDVTKHEDRSFEEVVVKEEADDSDDGSKSSGNTRITRYRGKRVPQEIKTEGDEIFECSQCNVSFFTKNGFVKHMLKHGEVRLKPTIFTCALCLSRFDSNPELIQHKLAQHAHDTTTYMCEPCELAFTQHRDYVIHELHHTKKKFHFDCRECNVKFTGSKANFAHHIRSHYDMQIKCAICDQEFKTEILLKNHLNIHESRHTCSDCGKRFATSGALSRHMDVHTGDKKHACTLCPKTYTTKQHLRTHEETHSNERPYQCVYCKFAFRRAYDLKIHSCRVNKRVRKYQCDVCQKRFNKKCSVAPHMLLHTQYRPFPCLQCKAKFASEISLRTHVVYKHTSERPYRCDSCGAGFKSKGDLNRHGRRMLACDKYKKKSGQEPRER